MKSIDLTQNQVALVDDSDFELVNQFKWHAVKKSNGFYARTHCVKQDGTRSSLKMHQLIMGTVGCGILTHIDHINHDTLDNRRCNLQKTDHRGNMSNRHDQSKYGVGIEKHGSKFRAVIKTNGKRVRLGPFVTPQEARDARTKFLKEPPQ